MEEEWKSIFGFDGYEVSNLGRIRSWKRNSVIPHMMKPQAIKPGGYIRIHLQRIDKKEIELSVHVLVMQHFGEPKPGPKYMCCHNNGIPSCNRIDNLRWDTHKGNMADKIKHGTLLEGERHPRSKLMNSQAYEIRQKYLNKETGVSYSKLSKMYGVAKETIADVIKNRCYRV